MDTIKQAQQYGMMTAGVLAALIAILFLARLVAEIIVYCAGLCLN